MSTDSQTTPTTADFGANEWLIDEMRDAYAADPTSVDPKWREFFAAEGGSTSGAPAAKPAATPVVTPAEASAKAAAQAPAPAPDRKSVV